MPTEKTMAKVEAEQAVMEAERRSLDAKAAGTRALEDQAKATSAETMSKIDRMGARGTNSE